MKLNQKFIDTPIAHRGLHNVKEGFPENSIEAIERALSKGYGIELDVQMSVDKKAMVFHDYELERLTDEKGPICEKYSSELRDISLLGGQQGIPLLSDVLDLVDGQQPLLIEIKDQDGKLGKNVGHLEREIAKLIATYNGPTAVMSFNPHAIQAYCSFGGKGAVGLVTEAFKEADWPNIGREELIILREIDYFDIRTCDFISHDFRDLSSLSVNNLRQRGVPVLSWTIKSEVDEEQARKKSDNITFEGYMASHVN